MADETMPVTRGEIVAGIFGAVLFLALAVLAVDLATGGRVFSPRGGCGCQEGGGDDGRD
jgi:ABC-type Na+ efflux pump permease subunit